MRILSGINGGIKWNRLAEVARGNLRPSHEAVTRAQFAPTSNLQQNSLETKEYSIVSLETRV